MAGSKSDYLENKVLDAVFNGTSWTTINNVYVALFTGTLSGDTPGTEVSGGSYARVSTAPADWTAASSGSLNNGNAITFPAPTANWGTVTHFGIFDASTSGNALYYGDLTTSRTINNGDGAPSFASGALVVTES
jgi:hypothetical protein